MKRCLAGLLFLSIMLATASARADETEPRHTAGPWITIGIGGGVAAIGVLSFVGALKAHDDAQAEAAAKGCTTSPVVCPAGVDATNLKTNVDGEHAMNVIGVVMTATGGAAIIAGILWHVFEHPSSKTRTAITVAPTLGGVVLAGQF